MEMDFCRILLVEIFVESHGQIFLSDCIDKKGNGGIPLEKDWIEPKDAYVYVGQQKLRRGYTTGSCAAAAAQAAARALFGEEHPQSVQLAVPKGLTLSIPVHSLQTGERWAKASVCKDSGDDPDVTNGIEVFVTLSVSDRPGIAVCGGVGVGRITKPGLQMPVGEAAINLVPRRMIREQIEQVRQSYPQWESVGLRALVEIPQGVQLAAKTYNPRLGIEGGISVLGTSGIVEPMSEQALLDTIRVELRQRRENGADYILLAPGNYSADYIRDFIGLDPKTAVLTSNFIGDSLEFCKEFGFHGALLIGHIGKFVKLAGGMWNTHSKFGDCRMEIIASHSAALGLRAERTEEILHCATCDDALRILDEEGLKDAFLVRLGQRIGTMLGYKSGELQSGAILFSKEYGFLCETEGAEELLEQIREG